MVHQTELKVGQSYSIKMIDQTYPVLERNAESGFVDTGTEETIAGKSIVITVQGFPADRPGFALVRNHEKGKEHLVHIPSIETAAPVSAAACRESVYGCNRLDYSPVEHRGVAIYVWIVMVVMYLAALALSRGVFERLHQPFDLATAALYALVGPAIAYLFLLAKDMGPLDPFTKLFVSEEEWKAGLGKKWL